MRISRITEKTILRIYYYATLALFEFKQLKKYSTIASFPPITIFSGNCNHISSFKNIFFSTSNVNNFVYKLYTCA